MDHMGQWLPGSMVSALMESYEYVSPQSYDDPADGKHHSFSRLSEHLANLSAASLAASLPPVQASKQEKVTKRKVAPGSRGVEVRLHQAGDHC